MSREYAETAAWSADFTVHVRTGFTLEQIGSVRAALGASTATVTAAAGDDLAAWEVELANPSGATPAPTAAPLIVDERGTRLVTGAAALPDVTIAQQDVSTTIRVRTRASLPAAATWLRGHLDRNDSSSVYVGTATTWTASVSVTGVTAASDTSIATAAALTAAHPDLRELSVSGSGVTGVVSTERQAREVVADFEETPADSAGQRVSVWWPDGNGSQVSGRVGARR